MLRTIQFRLILLTLIVSIPLVFASFFTVGRLAAEQSRGQQQALVATTRALAAAVDAELNKYIVFGYTLSTSVPLDEGNLARFHAQATEAVTKLPGAWIVVADVEGQQIVNTLRKFGETLPLVEPLEVHRQALQTGTEKIGGLKLGPVVQRPALGVFIPILKPGKPKQSLVVGLDPHVFTKVLENQRLPEGWVAGIGDHQGNFVARSVENDRYIAKPISDGWLNASRSGREGYFETISQEGVLLNSAFSNLEHVGWTVSVGASQAVLNAPTRKSFWIATLVSAALVLISVMFTWFSARPIIKAMRSLQTASSSLLTGERTDLKRTGLSEVDLALTAFESAARTIMDRERSHSLLVDELNHRVKNTLAVVQSLALLAKQTAQSTSEFSSTFVKRIVSLAQTHDLLTNHHWEKVQLGEILKNELKPFFAPQSGRILLSGQPVYLNSKEAIAISMIVHELTTNAAKYGALSNEKGAIRISWDELTDRVRLDWQEIGGPPVSIPQHRSFGTKLITSQTSTLTGETLIEFLPGGLHFAMTFPKET